MEIYRFKQLRPKACKVVNNYTCMSQTKYFDSVQREKEQMKKSNIRHKILKR